MPPDIDLEIPNARKKVAKTELVGPVPAAEPIAARGHLRNRQTCEVIKVPSSSVREGKGLRDGDGVKRVSAVQCYGADSVTVLRKNAQGDSSWTQS